MGSCCAKKQERFWGESIGYYKYPTIWDADLTNDEIRKVFERVDKKGWDGHKKIYGKNFRRIYLTSFIRCLKMGYIDATKYLLNRAHAHRHEGIKDIHGQDIIPELRRILTPKKLIPAPIPPCMKIYCKPVQKQSPTYFIIE